MIFAIFLFNACTNDFDKNISTNFQVEAKEIFKTSLALGESLRYVFYNFEDYQNALNDTLPGCPTILIDEIEKKVEIQFFSSNNCKSLKITRSGSIILDFNSTNPLDQEITVFYVNYKVMDFEIKGNRRFKKSTTITPSNQWKESFDDLLILDEFQNGTKITGSYDHTLEIFNNTLISFTSSGSIEGRNLTGRPLKMTQTTPRQYQNICIEVGQVIASSGVENWEIFRTPTRSLVHTLTFLTDSTCDSKASVQLSDGRLIIFEQ